MFQQVLQPATDVRIFHTIRQGYSFRSKSEKKRVPSDRSLFFCHSLVGSHSTTYNCIPISAQAISDVKYRTENLQQGHIASRNESSAAMYLDDQRWEEQICARIIT